MVATDSFIIDLVVAVSFVSSFRGYDLNELDHFGFPPGFDDVMTDLHRPSFFCVQVVAEEWCHLVCGF